MKKHIKKTMLVLMIGLFVLRPSPVQAAIPFGILEIIKAGVVKVIRAVDLKIQRLQNQTIWLQNAQKVLENTLSKTKLREISEWSEKQKEQYRKYYEELGSVKAKITYYQRIRDITKKQVRLINEYSRAWQLLQKDKHFTAEEIKYMGKVYQGILKESAENIEQISLVIRSFSLQMSDAKRLELINTAADQVDTNYDDLKQFNSENILLSLQRSKTQVEVDYMKKIYGLP